MSQTQSGYERKARDLYETPEWVTEALIRQLPPLAGEHVWEPAAGDGKMAKVLARYATQVHKSDIHQYTPDVEVKDFLKVEGRTTAMIITNPPYGFQNNTARKFIEQALRLTTNYVAMLCTVDFDSGSTRVGLFRDNRRFWKKIVLLDRIEWFERAPGQAGPTANHAWYIWGPVDAKHQSPIIKYEPKLTK